MAFSFTYCMGGAQPVISPNLYMFNFINITAWGPYKVLLIRWPKIITCLGFFSRAKRFYINAYPATLTLA